MKFAELKRELKKIGCRKDHEGANHEIWYSPITNLYFPISRHNGEEVKNGTLKSIKRDSGLK